ncbi:hypothetical protein [Streptomyces sp. SID3343]|uniref:hypothetical protein n=1 Tax=Streptomyces sp. SID3343 TaxID=2690260 RepID=UPI001371AB49|nr:hypothetical protein [Streptomyces sp. SID3343]MYW03435.1 hypothetical protein [Streptomyces sp. SID3343]
MRALVRLGRVTITAAATIALVTGLPAGVHAAIGDFGCTDVNGDEFRNDDPEDGECFLLVAGAVHADHDTDTRAVVYLAPGCEEGPFEMRPHTSRDFRNPAPHSVRFV